MDVSEKENINCVSPDIIIKTEPPEPVITVDLTENAEKEDGEIQVKREEESGGESDFPEDFFDDLANIEFIGGLNVIDTWEPDIKVEVKQEKNVEVKNTDVSTQQNEVKRINPFNKQVVEAIGIKEIKSNDGLVSKQPQSHKRDHGRDTYDHRRDSSIHGLSKDFIETSSYHIKNEVSNSRHRSSRASRRDRSLSRSPNRRSHRSRSVERPRRRFEPPLRRYKPSPPDSPYRSKRSERRHGSRKSRTKRSSSIRSRPRRSRSRRSRTRSYTRSRSRYRRYTSRKITPDHLSDLSFSPDRITRRHTRSSLSRFSISPARKRSPFFKEISKVLRKSSFVMSNPPIPGVELPQARIPGTNPENPALITTPPLYSYSQTYLPNVPLFGKYGAYAMQPPLAVNPVNMSYKSHGQEMYDPANPLPSPNKFNSPGQPGIKPIKSATEVKNEKNDCPAKKLFADTKIKLTELLSMSQKNADASSTSKSLESKNKVLTRCQDALTRLEASETLKVFPKKFIYNQNYNKDFVRVILPSTKYVSPLRRTPSIKFKFTTIDPHLKGKTQRIKTLLTTLDIKLVDETAPKITKLVNTTPAVTVPAIEVKSDKVLENTSRKMVQTDPYICGKCTERDNIVLLDVGCQVDVRELAALSVPALMDLTVENFEDVRDNNHNPKSRTRGVGRPKRKSRRTRGKF